MPKRKKGRKGGNNFSNNNTFGNNGNGFFVVNPMNYVNNSDGNDTVNGSVNPNKIGMYTNKDKILLIGEGDFSFGSTLVSHLHYSKKNSNHDGILIASSYDSKDICIQKYGMISEPKQNIYRIKKNNGMVFFDVDGTKIHECKEILKHCKLFDYIVFMFPHCGGSMAIDIEKNTQTIRDFMLSAKIILNKNGKIHICLRDNQFYNSWNIEKIGKYQCNLNCKVYKNYRLNRFIQFGYKPQRTKPSITRQESPNFNKCILYEFTLKNGDKSNNKIKLINKRNKLLSKQSISLNNNNNNDINESKTNESNQNTLSTKEIIKFNHQKHLEYRLSRNRQWRIAQKKRKLGQKLQIKNQKKQKWEQKNKRNKFKKRVRGRLNPRKHVK